MDVKTYQRKIGRKLAAKKKRFWKGGKKWNHKKVMRKKLFLSWRRRRGENICRSERETKALSCYFICFLPYCISRIYLVYSYLFLCILYSSVCVYVYIIIYSVLGMWLRKELFPNRSSTRHDMIFSQITNPFTFPS